jgi:hypothetical protein
MSELELQVIDGDIVVTLPRTDYTVTYFKPERSPQLLAKDISARDDPRLPMTGAEFLAKAWRLAKARISGAPLDEARRARRAK